MIGHFLYPPTWLHDIRASVKLLLLLVVASLLMVQTDWRVFALALLVVLAIYVSLGWRAVIRLKALRTLLPLLVIIYLLQWYVAGHGVAVVSIFRLMVMIMLADLVTMTTPMQQMLDTIEPVLHPLHRFGLNTAQLSLGIALVIRFVPVLFDLWSRRTEAWRARSSRRIPFSLIKLVLLDTLRMADHVAEALDARGLGGNKPQGRQ